VGSAPLFLGRAAASGSGSDYTWRDEPPDGEWLYGVRPVEPEGEGLESLSEVVALVKSLTGAGLTLFPNPWRLDGPPLNVDYFLPTEGDVRRARLELVDIAGRMALALPELTGNGRGRLQWSGPEGRRLAAGIYYLRMIMDGTVSEVRRLVVIR
jgi:hypothetical protein